jgi:outer membrane protein assembly factor BamB
MLSLIAAAFVLAQLPAPTPAPGSPAIVTFATLDPRWTVSFSAPPAAPSGFDTGAAYVALKNGQLVAINLDRGTIRWQIEAPTNLQPATGDGLVFIASENVIQGIDAATGAVRWHAALPGGAAAPLYWDTGWLIASTPAGDLAAFRASDGSLIWRKTLGAALAAPPAPALDRLYFALTDGRLISASLSTGEILWTRSIAGQVSGLQALDDQLVFGTTENEVQSVDLLRGKERWTRRVGGDVAGLPIADERRIYFTSRDNLLRAVDRKSGNLKWMASLPSRPASGPLRIADLVVVPSVSTDLSAFDAETGKPAPTIKAAGELGIQPFLRTGSRSTAARLITVSRDGLLQGFGLRFEPPPAPVDVVLPGERAVP